MDAYDVNKDESYSKEEKEYLILPVKEATTRWFCTRTQDYCNAQQRTLAYFDVAHSKMVSKSKYYISIVWNIDDDQEKEYKTRFQEGKVYRIKAKKWIGGGFYFQGKFPDDAECLYVTEVLGIVEDCPELEEIYEEFIRPVTVHHETLGEFTLDKDIYALNGKVPFNGRNISVSVFVKEGKEKSWQKNINHLADFYSAFENTDKLAKELVSNKLYKLACDYNENGITRENIAERITVTSITLINSQVEIDYDDNEIFGGHSIVVEGSIKSGLKKAYICG